MPSKLSKPQRIHLSALAAERTADLQLRVRVLETTVKRMRDIEQDLPAREGLDPVKWD